MIVPNPIRFVMDTSGLNGALDRDSGSSRHVLPPSTLTKLAHLGRIAVPAEVVEEVEIPAVKKWVSDHTDDTDYHDGLHPARQRDQVLAVCSKLRRFTNSRADVGILCTTLEMIEQSIDDNSGIDHVIVLEDVSFAAACTLCGVSSIPSRVFFALVGAIDLSSLAALD